MEFTYKAIDLQRLTSELYYQLQDLRREIEDVYLEANSVNHHRMEMFKSLIPKYKYTNKIISKQVLEDYFGGIPYIKYEYRSECKSSKGMVDVDFVTLDIPEHLPLFISKVYDSVKVSSTDYKIDYMYFYVCYYQYKSNVDTILAKLETTYDLCEGVYEIKIDLQTRVWLNKLQESLMKLYNGGLL